MKELEHFLLLQQDKAVCPALAFAAERGLGSGASGFLESGCGLARPPLNPLVNELRVSALSVSPPFLHQKIKQAVIKD